MPLVKVSHLNKRFGNVIAVDDVTFNVNNGELVTLLGPSGCGKTTTLRSICGLEIPDTGEIIVGDKTFTSIEKGIFISPEKRKMGMVFQNYAIWPHMTVFENIAYGLRVRRIPKSEVKRRVEKILELVNLTGLEYRHPSEISGGQQQRTALARSLIYEPEVLLLDEPLSNLDAKLRIQTRSWLKELQKELKTTSVYVTHDQAEAMAISDRIIVMNNGKIVQEGVPSEIYKRPASRFVAEFIGNTNFLDGIVIQTALESDTFGVVKFDINEIRCSIPKKFKVKDKITISVKPEEIELYKNNPVEKVNVLRGVITKRAYLGRCIDYRVKIGAKEISVESNLDIEVGESVYVYIPSEFCSIVE
jgi:iron(III) transport system ATP-binding protein